MKNLLFILFIFLYLERAYGLYSVNVPEDTTVLDGQSTFIDNTVILRVARFDPATGCNQPKILLRSVIAGTTETEQINFLDLSDEGNARIPLDNFCSPAPGPKRRSIYIFEDNQKRDLLRRISTSLPSYRYRRHFRRTTGDKSKSKSKGSDESPEGSPAAPPSEDPLAPKDDDTPKEPKGDDTPKEPKGDDTPKEPKGDDTPKEPKGDDTPKEPKGDDTPKEPKGDDTPKEPKVDDTPKEGPPKAVGDKIKILTFASEYVLIYFPCGEKVCGEVYSHKDIKAPAKSIDFDGNCVEITAVQGSNGFLYLCYRDVESSIIWETWVVDGAELKKAYNGIISNVTVPDTTDSEGFSGGLFKTFSTGPSAYSIVMGSFAKKPSPISDPNRYNPPVELFSYFLTGETLISGPFSIYQNLGGFGGSIEFRIQACNPIYNSGGYKCLVSYKVGATDELTTYVAISFSPAGEPIATNTFTIPHGPKDATPATLSLSYGGWCIGVFSTTAGLDCFVYNEAGERNGTWGIPTGFYGPLGGTPSNIMWAVPKTADPLSWNITFSSDVANFQGI